MPTQAKDRTMFIILCRKRKFTELISKLAIVSHAYGKNLALDEFTASGRREMADAFGKSQRECLAELYRLLGHKG